MSESKPPESGMEKNPSLPTPHVRDNERVSSADKESVAPGRRLSTGAQERLERLEVNAELLERCIPEKLRSNPHVVNFVVLYLFGNKDTKGNAKASYMKAYDNSNENSSASSASVLLKRLSIPMEMVLSACGVDDEVLAHKCKEGLEAVRQRSFLHQKTGEVVMAPAQVDYSERRQMVHLVMKVLGRIKEKKDISGRIAVEAVSANRSKVERAEYVVESD